MSRNDERAAVRMLVKSRMDFQAMRKKLDNRIGRKADGTDQVIEERRFRAEDLDYAIATSDHARKQEALAEKVLMKRLEEFSIYTEFLKGCKGVGPVAAGWIIGEIDIERAVTVSKIWQFAGLNPGLVRGKKRVQKGKTFTIVTTDTLVRGDKQREGFVSPFNKQLRTALVGVMADGFVKQQNEYALKYYYPYKTRLEQEANKIEGSEKAWSETSKGHRDRAAKRYMVKMFLLDLYLKWRELEGLPVRSPYQGEYLGHMHEGAQIAA
jgi:hypothetical protein